MLLVWNRMIRIVYQFLRLSWYVVVRWGWGWGWVVAVARMVPHRREDRDQRSQDAVMSWCSFDRCGFHRLIPQRHAFALPHALHLHHSSMTASLSSFGLALAPWTWLEGFKFLLRARWELVTISPKLVLEGHCYAWQYESFFFFKFIEKPHNWR